MGTNNVLNTKTDEDLIAKSVIDFAKECIWFGVKDVFVSSVVVNARRKSASLAYLIKFFKINVPRISNVLLIT